MGDRSKIEWTDATWNPVTGCTKVSQGCKNCYAERQFPRVYPGRDFTDVRLHPDRLGQPLHWKRPRRIFVNSMSDLFHDEVRFGFVMQCLGVMVGAYWHTYQILTKRPARMKDFFTRWADLSGEDWEPKLARGPAATRKAHPSLRGKLFADMLESMGKPPQGYAYPTFDWLEGMIHWPVEFKHIHLGVSCEDQKTADERIPLLLQTPAAVRFVSLEPLVGAIDLGGFLDWSECCANCGDGSPFGQCCDDPLRVKNPSLDWVIVGGESGPKARPMYLDWIRSIRDQCLAARVPFFFKQGSQANWQDFKNFKLFPVDLQIREFPSTSHEHE